MWRSALSCDHVVASTAGLLHEMRWSFSIHMIAVLANNDSLQELYQLDWMQVEGFTKKKKTGLNIISSVNHENPSITWDTLSEINGLLRISWSFHYTYCCVDEKKAVKQNIWMFFGDFKQASYKKESSKKIYYKRQQMLSCKQLLLFKWKTSDDQSKNIAIIVILHKPNYVTLNSSQY